MEDLSELFGSLSIGPQMGLAFFLMVITVGIVNAIKRLLCRTPWKWTAKIPSEIWWAVSIVIPVAICLAFNWDLIETIAGEAIEGVTGKLASVASGVVVGLAGQASYGGKKAVKSVLTNRLGAETTRDFTPGGPNDTAYSFPTPVVPDVTVVQEVQQSETRQQPQPSEKMARLLLEVRYPKDGPSYYVWTGEHLLPVSSPNEQPPQPSPPLGGQH